MRIDFKKIFSCIFVFYFLSVGCTQKIGKFQYVYVDEIPTDGIRISKATAENALASGKGTDCYQVYFIFPNALGWDLQKATQATCPYKTLLRNTQLEISSWAIPFIYANHCINVSAACHAVENIGAGKGEIK